MTELKVYISVTEKYRLFFGYDKRSQQSRNRDVLLEVSELNKKSWRSQIGGLNPLLPLSYQDAIWILCICPYIYV